jgi:cytochrome c-type biogenesis protein CcmH/NrfG
VGLADALRRAGRNTEALQALREGFRVHPDHPAARVGLARVHVAMGNRALAVAVLDDVVRSDAENLAALSLLCRLLVEEGRVHDARPHVERLRRAAPDDPSLVLFAERAAAPDESAPRGADPFDAPRLAARFSAKGHYHRALGIWRRIAEAHPDSAQPRQQIAALERAMAGLGDVPGERPLPPGGRRPLPELAEVVAALGDEPTGRRTGRGRLGAWARAFGRTR